VSHDERVVEAQLGRAPRAPWRIAARCSFGYPQVIASPSVLEDGDRFPTTFWLTCPFLAERSSALESAGAGEEWTERVAASEPLAVMLDEADAEYRRSRAVESGGADVCADVGIAGSQDPHVVKCVHAHVAAALAGIGTPVGRAVLESEGAACEHEDCAGLLLQSGRGPCVEGARMSGSGTGRSAAIDIGTNSTRLLLAEVTGGDVREIVRSTTVTRLGEGLGATGRLSEAAIARTNDVVADYLREASDAGPDRVRAVATSAARDAENGSELLDSLAALGIEPEIITGPREAYLSFLGAAYGMAPQRMLVCVVGSIEDAEDHGVEIETARSVDVGSRRATEMFLASDPPSDRELEEAAEWIAEQLRPFFDGLRERPRAMVSVGGTATTLSALHLKLSEYDSEKVHMSELTGADLAVLREELSCMTIEQRRGLGGMDPARADVVVAGAAIMEAVIGLAGLDRTAVSEHDILYGLVLEDA
jgi:exopolyphosphatase/guanosine-5'-triphosphate,3'-diphosphate pyrophosphatase